MQVITPLRLSPYVNGISPNRPVKPARQFDPIAIPTVKLAYKKGQTCDCLLEMKRVKLLFYTAVLRLSNDNLFSLTY